MLRIVLGNNIRDIEPVDDEVLKITGRNDLGLIEYILTVDYVCDCISLNVFVDKKDVTQSFFEDIHQQKSLAYYRGGKSTRLLCDVLRRIIFTQDSPKGFGADASFMMYVFGQIDFVCKENIEDTLGVHKIKDSKELLKDIRNEKKQEQISSSSEDTWL